MDLFSEYRNEHPVAAEPSEYREMLNFEIKRALQFGFDKGYDIGWDKGYDMGWDKGFARAKDFWAHKKLNIKIAKEEDGYWLIIDVPAGSARTRLPDLTNGFVQMVVDEAVKLGAEAPQSREVAQATASESTEETTPSGATDPKSEVAP